MARESGGRAGRAGYLEDERRAGLQLQQTGAAQGFEHGVWVVAESLVHHQRRLHVVHDEADLVGAAAGLGEAFLRARHGGRQTHHHGVVDDRAILQGGKERDDIPVTMEDKDSAL